MLASTLSLFGLFSLTAASQAPFSNNMDSKSGFKLREGAKILSPKDLIELPRPGSGVANSAGDLAFVGVSQHFFADSKTEKKIFIAPLNSTATPIEYPTLIGGSAFWLDSRTLAHVKENELHAVSLEYTIEPVHVLTPSSPILIGSFPKGTSPSNFKYVPGARKLVFSASVFDDVDLTTVEEQNKAWENRGDTGRIYDKPYVRHWDTYRGPTHSSLFSVDLGKDEDGKWALGSDYFALLKGTRHATPVEPFGGAEDFAVSESGVIAYTAKDPDVSEATHTRQNVYLVPLSPSDKVNVKPKHLTSGRQGATRGPVFSPDGKKVAWISLAQDGYESDQGFIFIHDLEKDVRFTVDFEEVDKDYSKKWDRSPNLLTFSLDGKSFFFTAGDEARVKVYTAPVPTTPSITSSSKYDKYKELVVSAPLPTALTWDHAASEVQPLPNGRLLFTLSSLSGPNNLYVISGLDDSHDALETEQITKFAEEGLKGKEFGAVDEVWFEGAEGIQVQGWVVKPPGWTPKDKKGTWPVLFAIHGGPQGAWEDQWSTRWNPQVFAQQGYFVVTINPTGSTTFGQAFTDAIAGDWGGRPFVDLQKGWKHVLETYPEIDAERAVAAGASYGGFAINWIAGHPEFGFNFKALVTHDGVFDTRYNGFVTDELFFFVHEFGGVPYSKKAFETSEKFNPSNFVDKWTTPQLIIHSSLDYRLPETDGIGAFHALQLRGVPSRILLFPDENHWVLQPGNSLRWHHEIFKWFDEFVGDKAKKNEVEA